MSGLDNCYQTKIYTQKVSIKCDERPKPTAIPATQESRVCIAIQQFVWNYLDRVFEQNLKSVKLNFQIKKERIFK